MPNFTFKIIILGIALFSNVACHAQAEMKHISQNGITVHWHFAEERIFFEMEAPSTGWLTIGFNTSTKMQGAYLLMGHILHGKAVVVEHYTLSPGDYRPIHELGGPIQVQHVAGSESARSSTIRFSLPLLPGSKFQRNLSPGQQYTLILAYSQEDDFQHHSAMRTSLPIKL